MIEFVAACCVTHQHISRTVDFYSRTLSMEINHNKENNIESSDRFVNFSIRDYVAEIRKKDPKKCWPFGSLGYPKNNEAFSSYKSPNASSDLNGSNDAPKETQATNTSKVEIVNEKEDLPKATSDKTGSSVIDDEGKVIYDGSSGSTSINNGEYRPEDSVDKAGDHVAAVNNKRKRKRAIRRKHRKTRLLADIYKDPASKLHARLDVTNPPTNVNRRFAAESEDDHESSDDVTLSTFCRKQKAAEVTDSTLKKKKRTTRVEFSKHESKDSTGNGAKNEPRVHLRKKLGTDDLNTQIISKSKEDYVLPDRKKFDRTEATETTNEDIEMEVVMLLARHFKVENPSANEQIRKLDTSTACACVQKKIHRNTTKNPMNTHLKFTKEKLQKWISSAQTVDHPKVTTAAVFQAHKELCSEEASGVTPVVQGSETLVCSVNRKQADFNIPDAENMFMRGG